MIDLQNHRLTKAIPILSAEDIECWRSARLALDSVGEYSSESIVSVQASGLAIRPHYSRQDGFNFPFGTAISTETEIRLRAGVVGRLLKMNEALEELGLETVVLDGYRSLETQTAIWHHFRALLENRNPGLSPQALDDITADYAWNPSVFDLENFQTWPVHMSGGSVDLTIRIKATGQDLPMGTIFDDPSSESHSDWFERLLISKGAGGLSASESAALLSRRICYNAALSVGLTPYWAEWWHYDFGTQLSVRFAHLLGQRQTIKYGIPSAPI